MAPPLLFLCSHSSMSALVSEPRREYYFRVCYPSRLMARLFGERRCATLQSLVLVEDEKEKYWKVVFPPLKGRESDALAHEHRLRSLQSQQQRGLVGVHLCSLITSAVPLPRSLSLQVFDEREFVIDMDLKDWGEQRALLCECDVKRVCSQCWLLAEMAAAVCRLLLQDACKLGPMLTVYSGGKGCHLWWGTPATRALTHEERHALVSKILGPPSSRVPVLVGWHTTAVAELMKVWIKRGIVKRALLSEVVSQLAHHLKSLAPPTFYWPDPASLLQPSAISHERWKAWRAAVGEDTCRRFVCELGWPRVDVEVTLGKSHMVKTPFAIHASSGKIALPLDTAGDCKPEWMPTVNELTNQVPPTDARGHYQARMWHAGLARLEQWLGECMY